jgi:ribosomal protein L29
LRRQLARVKTVMREAQLGIAPKSREML